MRRSLSLSLSLVWCVADLPGQPPPEPDVCVVGAWDPPFTHLDVGTTNPGGFVNKPNVNLQGPNHKFNALHMALIPTPGSRRGKVVVWDLHYPSTPAPDPATQRWSIVDPVAKTMENYDFTLPSGKGDLFCAGHGWTKDGKLFVVGGTEAYPQNGGYLGGKLAYIWDPDPTKTMNTGWVKQFDPKVNRWYPTVTMDDNNKLIVTGGLHHQTTNPPANFFNNDFEVFAVGAINPLTGTWESNNGVFVWQGPDMTKASKFTTYPRFHLLSTGEIFMSGHGPDSAKIRHLATNNTATPPWDYTVGDDPAGVYRHDGSSVLFPIELDPMLGLSKDLIYRMGGKAGSLYLKSVQSCQTDVAPLPPPAIGWNTAMSMAHGRLDPNAVLLPDGTILVVGGTDLVGTTPKPVKTPELYKNGQWIKMADHVSSRQYHSTALLLPSGKVLVGGGDVRSWDYEVYSPPYIFCGTRPQITNSPTGTLNYNTSYTVDFVALPQTPPTHVERVVLMRPGSVTHASCMDQRYISLELFRPLPDGATQVQFKTPASSKLAPRGYYMLFLVTNLGVPSVAAWVKLS